MTRSTRVDYHSHLAMADRAIGPVTEDLLKDYRAKGSIFR